MGEHTSYFAHTPEEGDDRAWQTLEDHLNNVASRARDYGDCFDAGMWGYALGVLHDAGKATPAFQRRLQGSSERVDHSTPGARLAIDYYNDPTTLGVGGQLMAFALAGHHGGMPDGMANDRGSSLSTRLETAPDHIDGFLALMKEGKVTLPPVQELEALPWLNEAKSFGQERCRFHDQATLRRYGVFSTAFFIRMIFSALVDADYLDTEEYVQPELAEGRNAGHTDMKTLLALLEAHMQRLQSSATDSPVNRARASILRDSRSSATMQPGVFTMTTPTGGGKTLASMMFALTHAVRYGMERVIVAIPFTSIVEQTAAVLKGIFGRENVLEHHSNYDFEADSEMARRERLAIQNWDAPIIVTTNVQLLESLYSNRPGKCRKLHNIARSVIILDEAQTIPDSLLMPSLAVLEDLTLDYRSSVVLCTATQPAIDELWPFGAISRPIVRHTQGFASAFTARSEFVVRGPMRESLLVDELLPAERALCIVGTKAKAKRLYEEVRDKLIEEGGDSEGVFHLSANMVPAHRSLVIEEARRSLDVGERCIVISTQLVEAGVDVDFPVVYRELAGIDSLFQAAGRCNRNGKLRDEEGVPVPGKVHVFELVDDEGQPDSQDLASNWLAKMKGIARQLIREHGGSIDDEMVHEFFARRYHTGDVAENLDGTGLYRDLTAGRLLFDGFRGLSYRSYAERFKIISDDTTSVFIPWEEEGRMLYGELQRSENPASLAMRLQRYSVSVYPYLMRRLENAGVIETYGPITVLRVDDDCRSFYSEEVGLLQPGEEELNTMLV